MPSVALAQPVGAPNANTLARRTFDIALNVAWPNGKPEDAAYFGLSAQYVTTPKRHVLFGSHTGIITTGPRGDACTLRPDGGCYELPDFQWYLTPLVGTGLRAGILAARVFAGPRITLAGPAPRWGVQMQADLTLGGEHVALYIPLTFASMRGQANGGEMGGVGLGLQFR